MRLRGAVSRERGRDAHTPACYAWSMNAQKIGVGLVLVIGAFALGCGGEVSGSTGADGGSGSDGCTSDSTDGFAGNDGMGSMDSGRDSAPDAGPPDVQGATCALSEYMCKALELPTPCWDCPTEFYAPCPASLTGTCGKSGDTGQTCFVCNHGAGTSYVCDQRRQWLAEDGGPMPCVE
jgi:hypothetical protein